MVSFEQFTTHNLAQPSATETTQRGTSRFFLAQRSCTGSTKASNVLERIVGEVTTINLAESAGTAQSSNTERAVISVQSSMRGACIGFYILHV